MKRFCSVILCLLPTCLVLAGPVSANLINNGSFEGGAYDDTAHPGYMRLLSGSTVIDDWIVGGNGLDWHIGDGSTRHFGPAQDGSYVVDLALDGNTGSYSIEQSFITTPGTEYQLSFYLGAPRFDTAVDVFVAGATQRFELPTVADNIDFPWMLETLSFTASSDTSTLLFKSVYGNYWGPVIDNVSVEASAVPEPATLLLFGVGFFGFAALRKKITA